MAAPLPRLLAPSPPSLPSPQFPESLNVCMRQGVHVQRKDGLRNMCRRAPREPEEMEDIVRRGRWHEKRGWRRHTSNRAQLTQGLSGTQNQELDVHRIGHGNTVRGAPPFPPRHAAMRLQPSSMHAPCSMPLLRRSYCRSLAPCTCHPELRCRCRRCSARRRPPPARDTRADAQTRTRLMLPMQATQSCSATRGQRSAVT